MALLYHTGFETLPAGSNDRVFVDNMSSQGWVVERTTVAASSAVTGYTGSMDFGVVPGRYASTNALKLYRFSSVGAISTAKIALGKTFRQMLDSGGFTLGFAGYTNPSTNGNYEQSIGFTSFSAATGGQMSNSYLTISRLASTSSLSNFRYNSSGSIGAYTIPMPATPHGTWNYFEIIVNANPPIVGRYTMKLRMNGSEFFVSDGTGVFPAAALDAPAAIIMLQGVYPASTSMFIAYDDIYVIDRSGTTMNGEFLGEVTEARRGPSTDVSVEWDKVGAAASNAASVNKRDYADTTTAVTSSVAGATDLYSSSDTLPTGKIYNISIESYGTQTGGTGDSMTNVVSVGGTEYPGTAVAVGTTPTYVKTDYNVNPNTNQEWSAANATSLQFGIQKA